MEFTVKICLWLLLNFWNRFILEHLFVLKRNTLYLFKERTFTHRKFKRTRITAVIICFNTIFNQEFNRPSIDHGGQNRIQIGALFSKTRHSFFSNK